MNDLRLATRMLRRNPAFTAAAVLTLALGIGANTAIFSVVDAYLLRPLPYPHADQLVAVRDVQPGWGEAPASFAEWRDLAEHARMFEALTASFATNANYAGGELPERVRVLLVGLRYFELVGLEPVTGRLFTPDEEREGAAPAVVLAEGFWRTRLGGRPDVIGDVVHLSDQAYTVVGVVREPDAPAATPVAAYAPLLPNAPFRDRGSHYLTLLGRLPAGTTLELARAELDALSARLQEERGTSHGWTIAPLRDQFADRARPLLLALLGSVGLVLLIATANVANLLLVRAAGRRTEFAVRSALGARRLHLVRQLLAESLVLAGLAAAAGVLIGVWGAPLLADALPASIPPPGKVGLDHRVLAFTGAVAIGASLLFGLAPALLELRRSGGVPGVDRSVTGKRGARRAREGLVVAELALALVLLIAAGLLLQSMHRLLRVDPGFAVDGLLAVSTTLPGARYGEPAQRIAFVDDVTGRIAALPGVRSVAVANHLPLTGHSMSGDLRIEGRDLDEADRPHVEKRIVSEGYFGTLGIPLRRGRLFGPGDGSGSAPVVVISEATAARLWPGDEALGKRIRSLICGDCWEEVVGVVADVRERALSEEPPLQVYYPVRQAPLTAMLIVIRTESDPGGLAAPIRRTVAAVDPLQPIYDVRTMRETVGRSVADRRLATVLLATFAALALVLAAVGVGGVISYAVARRTREIGLRMALGSSRAGAIGLVVGQAMRLAVIGAAIGLPAAVALAWLLRAQLYDVAPVHPATYAGGAALLTLVALASSYVPARRAGGIQPMEALRHE